MKPLLVVGSNLVFLFEQPLPLGGGFFLPVYQKEICHFQAAQ